MINAKIILKVSSKVVGKMSNVFIKYIPGFYFQLFACIWPPRDIMQKKITEKSNILRKTTIIRHL